ncbi:MAG TPA: PEP-CTERM sorting domain-containing protein [Pirellulales bacterium]|nr:PEP-CTERM sorting domain-containing protein [Pirellulales bacterium]
MSSTIWTSSSSALIFCAVVAAAVPLQATTTFVPVSNPKGIAYDDVSHTLYVASGSSVVRYDTQTNQFLPSIVLGSGQESLYGIDLSPDGKTLAVADDQSTTNTNWIYEVDTATGAATQVTFQKNGPYGTYEGGTVTVAFGADGNLLVSSDFPGSGQTPLRLYDPSTGNTTILGLVDQASTLVPNANRETIAIAEGNSSLGPIDSYNVETGVFQHATYTNWFNAEVGVNSSATQYAVSTYDGTFIYNSSFQQIGMLGQYANNGPIDVVYSPNSNVMYASWWSYGSGTRQVREFSTTTFQQIGTLDAFGSQSGSFNQFSNYNFSNGDMTIAADGSELFATIPGGISIINLPEPGTFVLAGIGLVALVGAARRNKPGRRHRQATSKRPIWKDAAQGN